MVLSTHNLRKEFGDKVAVADLTIEVQRGEVFGFLGPNGAGKTTSVKMLLSLTHPTAGSATLLGRPLGDRAARARVGFLPEHFRFHEWLTAAEFLELHADLYGMSTAHAPGARRACWNWWGCADAPAPGCAPIPRACCSASGWPRRCSTIPNWSFSTNRPPAWTRWAGGWCATSSASCARGAHRLPQLAPAQRGREDLRPGGLHSRRPVLRTATIESFEEESFPVILRVGRPTPELLAGLARFDPGVSLEPANGRITLCLAGEAQLPQLAAWVVEQGHALYELTPTRLSLEDRFLQIVGEDASEG